MTRFRNVSQQPVKSQTRSITAELTKMNMLASAAALLLACAAFAGFQLIAFRRAMVRTLSIQAQIVGADSVSAILFNDPRSAENTLAALRAGPDIIDAEIYTPDGRPFAGYCRDCK
ncbi:MAG: CHASE sensor domain-containing protein, partial [Terriglobia bacterium]